MKAVVIREAGPPEVLLLEEIPKPELKDDWVLIRVRAFGLNRSEMFTRQGHSPNVKFPRVLGIECVGIIEDANGTDLKKGQKVAAIMGGMGREFDGGYAEYTSVPRKNVFPFETDLDWKVLGAIPEMFQTAYGSLTAGLDVRSGQTLLIRGGTSSIGMAATNIAKNMGLKVVSTTRNADKIELLKEHGVDQVVIDEGSIARQLREVFPGGVDRVLELVGAKTLIDSLKCAAPGGIVCMTGILGNSWTLDKFTPMGDIPHTVRLTVYMGEATNLSAELLQNFIDGVRSGENQIKIDRTFELDEIVEAHRYMESNQAGGKLVVLVN
ncbi:MAG: zinc-binding dehydrogenase [Acidobacteria bacterium]|nr:zinc-binding dehydrogenase [Acidobacteriota bacterium]